MAVFDLFSKRMRAARGQSPDVFVYDVIPEKLRVQICHIMADGLGNDEKLALSSSYPAVERLYRSIVEILRRELGVFILPPARYLGRQSYLDELRDFILTHPEVEQVLDAVELVCRAIDKFTRQYDYLHRQDANERATSALEEINERFREEGVGYAYEGEIIRVDSELVHADVVKPALTALMDKRFASAESEFRNAYEHYRHGRAAEALTEALKSLESTMKVICDSQQWPYKQTDTARTLIDHMIANGIVPSFWQTHFSSLRSLLESSVPTARNKLGGHGQGAQAHEVPNSLVSYVLHMTAATIVFLVAAEREM